MNPNEQYLPDSAAQPSNGSILAALMRIEKKVDAIALKQAGDAGLLALQVTAPPFVEEKPKGDDGWVEWKGEQGHSPVPDGTMGFIRLRNGTKWAEAGDISKAAWWWSDPEGAFESDILAYKITRPAQEQA